MGRWRQSGGATRYARNALLLSRASREWRRIAINFLSFFFSRTHRSPSTSLSPILSAVHSGFRSFWFRSELIRACTVPGRVSFVRSFVHSFTRSLAHSFVRSFVQDGWLALPRATGICIRDPTICISIPRDSRYRCHRRRRRCQTAGTNINTNSRVHRLLYTA